MSPAQIIFSFERRGHRFSLAGSQFKVTSSQSPLTPADIQNLKDHKSEVLHFLETRERELAEEMTLAIEELSRLCPEDVLDRLDHRQQRFCKELAGMPVRTRADIRRWREGWRTLFAELQIDETKKGVC